MKNESIAPLRLIVDTMPGPPEVHDLDGIGNIELATVVHKLECGHTTKPYVRAGCRLPKLPRRRRCQGCLKERYE